ncbi:MULTISPECIES: phytanoyl-CoA dioxygenase family protein [unclassified Amycolatopsis]|uniref:phytanoyl-CoA dioxygenase family protein n=1 Tax=unclassified Amycolatopsis TaxID=2618356 RepID=UPI0028746932|nr:MULTISPECIES: phytanoyl-CoA dioxygenase family protein [unclassified Amycolatopsis]MDS0139283.1 phytanoyl-CoA dioxygenase family protein [Amycolatopsis sp. 505]MDS0144515.1 phytanoyl-CoA dioxygenase family protein [Amycolatopsis sp. CM201R]
MTEPRVRQVTEAEVAAFREHGWVLLRDFVRPTQLAALAAEIRRLMGTNAQRHKDGRGWLSSIWRTYDEPGHESERLWEFATSAEVGRIGARFLRDRPVRFLRDEVYVKMPTEEGGGQPTPWHQDFAYANRDRSEQLNFWIALADIPANGGGMRYLSGSHRAGLLGRSFDGEADDTVTRHPELVDEYPVSPQVALRAGDAYAHHAMSVHGAWANTSDAIRWSYTVVLFDADARYTGVPWAARLAEKMKTIKINDTFEHPLTPIVWPTGNCGQNEI